MNDDVVAGLVACGLTADQARRVLAASAAAEAEAARPGSPQQSKVRRFGMAMASPRDSRYDALVRLCSTYGAPVSLADALRGAGLGDAAKAREFLANAACGASHLTAAALATVRLTLTAMRYYSRTAA